MVTYHGNLRSWSANQFDEETGMESIPVVVVLSAVGAALTFGIMVSCIDMAERAGEASFMTGGFNTFVERVKFLCSGGPGSSIACRLDVGSASVDIEGNTLKLVSRGKVLRSDAAPLPFLERANLHSGEYVLILVKGINGERIMVSRDG